MKSRLAILGMLVAGALFSTAGAGIAITSVTDDNASVAQYGTPTPTPTGTPGGEVLGEESGGGQPSGGGGLQPTRQVEAGATGGGSTLPFTGFVAIPVLLAGLALLTTGLVLRFRRDDESA